MTYKFDLKDSLRTKPTEFCMQDFMYGVVRNVVLDIVIIWILEAKSALMDSLEAQQKVVEMPWLDLISIRMRPGARADFSVYVHRLWTQPVELQRLRDLANKRVAEPYTEGEFYDMLQFCTCVPRLSGWRGVKNACGLYCFLFASIFPFSLPRDQFNWASLCARAKDIWHLMGFLVAMADLLVGGEKIVIGIVSNDSCMTSYTKEMGSVPRCLYCLAICSHVRRGDVAGFLPASCLFCVTMPPGVNLLVVTIEMDSWLVASSFATVVASQRSTTS
jgi:hypothetical protein